MLEFLRNFNHYDIVAFTLLAVVLIGSGAVKQITGRLKEESKLSQTANKYPELIQLYRKYFYRFGRYLGTPFSLSQSFIWNGKLSFPIGLRYSVLILTNALLAGIVISILKYRSLTFLLVTCFLVGIFIQVLLNNLIKKRFSTFNQELSSFLVVYQITTDTVYVPVYNVKKDPLIKHLFLFNVFGAIILLTMYLVFPYFL